MATTPLPPTAPLPPSAPLKLHKPVAPAPRRPWLLWIIAAVILAVIAYALFLRPSAKTTAQGQGRGGRDNNRAIPISAESAKKTDLEVRTVALGTVTPVNTVTVRSRIDGELQKIFFEEGKTVEAGAPLAEIDPRPLEVQKLQSEAQLAKDNALLENSRLDYERFKTLLEQDSVAKQQVDTQAALVRQYEAASKLDQAQVESSALQLSYAHVVSPIAGRIGLRLVDQGNMVHSSDANGIAVITQLRPITVLFSIPQDDVVKVMKRFATGEPMTVEAFDRDGHTLIAKGKLVTVDNQIDPTTGTIKLRAEFPNDDYLLFPNQFVNVQLLVEQLQGVTVVPMAAVQRGTAGTFVYLVSAEKTVSVRPVETGPSDKGEVVISKGVAPGDVVVVDGVDKLREGSSVEVISPANPSAASATTAPNRERPDGKRQHEGKRPPQN